MIKMACEGWWGGYSEIPLTAEEIVFLKMLFNDRLIRKRPGKRYIGLEIMHFLHPIG